MLYPVQIEKFIICLESCLFTQAGGKIRRLSGGDEERRIRRRYVATGARLPVATIRMRVRDPRNPDESTDVASAEDARTFIAPLQPLLDYAGVREQNFAGCVENCAGRR